MEKEKISLETGKQMNHSDRIKYQELRFLLFKDIMQTFLKRLLATVERDINTKVDLLLRNSIWN